MRARQALWTEAVLPSSGDRVAVLASCIGRKLLIERRICEEVEAVQDVFGRDTGFYSYGEVSPRAATHRAELHNLTMTITVFGESGCA